MAAVLWCPRAQVHAKRKKWQDGVLTVDGANLVLADNEGKKLASAVGTLDGLSRLAGTDETIHVGSFLVQV